MRKSRQNLRKSAATFVSFELIYQRLLTTYRKDDGGLGGQLCWNVDVHLKVRWVAPPVVNTGESAIGSCANGSDGADKGSGGVHVGKMCSANAMCECDNKNSVRMPWSFYVRWVCEEIFMRARHGQGSFFPVPTVVCTPLFETLYVGYARIGRYYINTGLPFEVSNLLYCSRSECFAYLRISSRKYLLSYHILLSKT